jgi:hypothetical protein
VHTQTKFALFLPLWSVLAITVWYLTWKGSYQTKKIWVPRLIVFAGALMFGLVLWTEEPSPFLIAAGLMISLVTFINIRAIRFCPNCSALNRQLGAFTSSNFCSKCGASLREQEP